MKSFLCFLLFGFLSLPAFGWNAAGHRLVAMIAWQELSPQSRRSLETLLKSHPRYEDWLQRTETGAVDEVFAEASVWPDRLRSERGTHFAEHDPLPGIADYRQHRRWHYADFDAQGRQRKGELPQRLSDLHHDLRQTKKAAAMARMIPWYAHLVGDVHQPLHLGRAGDAGGLNFPIKATNSGKMSDLHSFWDGLPGNSSLQGNRLSVRAQQLRLRYARPDVGAPATWTGESRAFYPHCFPEGDGLYLSRDFKASAKNRADERIATAGYRLGFLLETRLQNR